MMVPDLFPIPHESDGIRPPCPLNTITSLKDVYFFVDDELLDEMVSLGEERYLGIVHLGGVFAAVIGVLIMVVVVAMDAGHQPNTSQGGFRVGGAGV